MKKRNFTWDDIKKIVELKTFYIVLILSLLGVFCLLLEYIVFNKNPDSVYRGIFVSLGITLITSSAVSIVMEILLRLDIVDFMTERMLSVMPENIKGNTGVAEFFKDRRGIDWKSYINHADTFIKITGVSCNDILAAANFPIIKSVLETKQDLTIQILLLSPWSMTAKIRSESKAYKTKKEGILKTMNVITTLRDFISNLEDEGIDKTRIQLRLYDNIPSVSLVIDRKSAIVATFIFGQLGGTSPYFISKNTESDACVYNSYLEHFNLLWENATPLDSETDIRKLYVDQHHLDASRVQSNPEEYTNWLLDLNNLVTHNDHSESE